MLVLYISASRREKIAGVILGWQKWSRIIRKTSPLICFNNVNDTTQSIVTEGLGDHQSRKLFFICDE